LSGFTQTVEKRYFENHPTLGGDVTIKSSSFNAENGEISKTFEIESPESGAYYLDAWIMAPIINGSYAEYSSLLEYCQKHGKAIWPLLFDKVAQRDVFVINLLRDLTYTGNTNFIDAITKHLIETGKPWLTSMDIQVNYCRELMDKEEVNILKSINAISGSNTEPLVLNVSL